MERQFATTNKQFYVVRDVTQLEADFMGKSANSLPLENQICKTLIFNAYSALTP